MPTTIRIDDDVESYIRTHGKFGESYSDVLRRLLRDFGSEQQPDQDTDEKSPDEKGTRKRYKLHGHPVCSVIRWMGSEGWNFADARKVLNSYHLGEVNDVTIRCQLQWKQRGNPADLTPDQANELKARRGQA